MIRLFCFFLLVFSGAHFAEDLPTTQPAKVLNLTQQSFYLSTKRYAGKVRAKQKVNLGFEIPGKINSIFVHLGDSVKKGQTLAQLDTTLLEAEKKELIALLDQNKADLKLKKLTFKRYQQLKKQGHMTQQQVDEAQAMLSFAKSRIKRTQSNIDAKEILIQKAALLAPFDGTISHRFFDAGSIIAEGSALISMQQSGNKEFILGLPEKDRPLIDPSQLLLHIGNHSYSATWLGLSSELNSTSQTRAVRLAINDSEALIAGEFGYLDITLKIPQQCYRIPFSAITAGPKNTWNVLIANKTDTGYTVSSQVIDIIHSQGNDIYIKPTLKPNSLLIIEGLNRFVAGQTIEPLYSSDTTQRI